MTRGRPTLECVPVADARALRDRWATVLRSKRGSGFVDLLLDAMPGSRTRSDLPIRSRRWFERARNPQLRLPLRTAIELTLRFRRCGVSTPEKLCELLMRPEPAVLAVTPSAVRELVERVSDIIEAFDGYRIGKRAREELLTYCARFENLSNIAEGKKAVDVLKAAFGKDLRWQMTRICHLISVERRGTAEVGYNTASTLQLLENAFLVEQKRSDRLRRTGRK